MLLCEVLKLLINKVIGEMKRYKSSFVENRYCSAIFNCLIDFVCTDVIAENEICIARLGANRCARDSHKRRVGKCLANISRKFCVLRAMCLIRNDNDIFLLRQTTFELIFFVLKLKNGCENNSTRGRKSLA